MFKIEFIAEPAGSNASIVHSELALTKSIEEARDFADTHLSAVKAKYGAGGYRIRNESNVEVASGPRA